jgi:hypothetical protein
MASKSNKWLTTNTENCEMFPPNWHIATDENTAGHKGCTENPSKPITCGLQVHVSEECKTGYISSTVPYYWRPTTYSLMRTNLNLSCQAVPQLCKVSLASSRSSHHSHTLTDTTQVIFWHISYQTWKEAQLYNYRLIQKSLPAQAKKLIVTKRNINASRNKQHTKWQEVSHEGQLFSQPQTAIYTAKSDRWRFQEVICNYTLWMFFI